jgi:NADH-quinone oxidoreductase subunit I
LRCLDPKAFAPWPHEEAFRVTRVLILQDVQAHPRGVLRCRAASAQARIDGILNGGMGISSLLRKIFMVDLLQGLKVTFLYQDPKEIYTEQYPLQRPQVAERYRGAPRLNVNPDTNETMCIACDLCALACPENLIVVSSERNEKTRRKELTNFTYDLSRCMFCGLCEDACPTDALELTQDFELASYTRDGAIWNREMLEKGPQPTQYKR